MIPRYAPPEMAALFTDEARLRSGSRSSCWPIEAWAGLGVVPAEDRGRRPGPSAPTVDAAFVAAVHEREQVTDHDVAAFVDVVQERIGTPEGAWVHYGLDLLRRRGHRAVRHAMPGRPICCSARPRRSRRRAAAPGHSSSPHVPIVGRTHGMHAEPTTFGAKFALWALQADRDRRPHCDRPATRSPWASSPARSGTYSNIDPAVEAHVCAALGLTPVPATQVIARDRHAEFLYALRGGRGRRSS